MVNDLFPTCKISKKEALLRFIKEKQWAKTSDILLWSTRNYCNRGDRNARQLAKEGKIRRMGKEEKEMYFNPNMREDVWVYIHD